MVLEEEKLSGRGEASLSSIAFSFECEISYQGDLNLAIMHGLLQRGIVQSKLCRGTVVQYTVALKPGISVTAKTRSELNISSFSRSPLTVYATSSLESCIGYKVQEFAQLYIYMYICVYHLVNEQHSQSFLAHASNSRWLGRSRRSQNRLRSGSFRKPTIPRAHDRGAVSPNIQTNTLS